MTLLSKEIGHFVDGLLSADQEIVHADAARAFIRDHEDMLDLHLRDVIRRYIADEIKKRSQIPYAEPEQGVLFKGLPAAVTVRDGVTKPLAVCDWVDLQIGRELKVDNIANARIALDLYDQDLETLRPHMEQTGLTFAEAREQFPVAS